MVIELSLHGNCSMAEIFLEKPGCFGMITVGSVIAENNLHNTVLCYTLLLHLLTTVQVQQNIVLYKCDGLFIWDSS